jgi:hypothetical protein
MTTADVHGRGSGGYAIAGYDYQIEVPIWLALDLVLARRLTAEVVIEPATEEDLEADIDPCEPGRLTNTTEADGYRLIVQAKRRTGDAWPVADLKSLLEHGKSRPSAKQLLADPRSRYLLVTTAALNGVTAELGVMRPGNWPPTSACLPACTRAMQQGVSPSSATRTKGAWKRTSRNSCSKASACPGPGWCRASTHFDGKRGCACGVEVRAAGPAPSLSG